MLEEEIPMIALAMGGGVVTVIGLISLSFSPLGGAIAIVIGLIGLGTGLAKLFG